MKEAYVSFEVAKLLKEKGFNICVKSFYRDGVLKHNTCALAYYAIPNNILPAPTHQMAMKWLRETTNYEIDVFCSEVDKNFKRGYSYDIFNVVDVEEKSHQEHGFNTYEEGVEAALEYTLKKLL